eukprot:7915010-Lingulodinium_polyedra.AAC.1
MHVPCVCMRAALCRGGMAAALRHGAAGAGRLPGLRGSGAGLAGARRPPVCGMGRGAAAARERVAGWGGRDPPGWRI